MNFSFPQFTRASTDSAYTQPPQASLLELVIEAKGRLGLVPQREVPRRHPSSTPFSHFSDSDEEGEGPDADATESAAQQDAVLTTRTSWVPPTYLLDYFFSSEFLSVFLTLHNISASRPASMLVPPILTVRDAQLHPLVEAGLCAVLQDAALGSSRQQHSAGGGGRVGRGGAFAGRPYRGVDEGSYTDSNAAAANIDGPSMSHWGATQRHRPRGAVLGAEEGNNDVGGRGAWCAPRPSFCAAEREVCEPPGAPLAPRLLFRGLQQVALPALLLGDHVLLSGPRGIGKRTAALLSAGANVLAFVKSHDSGAAEETEAPPVTTERAGEAAAGTPQLAAEKPAPPSPAKTEGKYEAVADDAGDAAGARPTLEKSVTDSAPASQPLPRALMLFPSYPEALFAAHWLRSTFGPEAFAAYTLKKDEAALRPLLEVTEAGPQRMALGGGEDTCSSDVFGQVGAMPAFSGATSGRRFIGPLLSLPFITDTNGATGVVGVPPRLTADPTQAEPSPFLTEASAPALAELAALVMGASLPAAHSETAPCLAGERANGGDATRKRGRDVTNEGEGSEGAGEEGGEKRSSRSHRRRHRHRSDHGNLESDDDDGKRACASKKRSPHYSSSHRHRSRHDERAHRGEEAASRGERDASGHRSRRRHRHHSDEVDIGDSGTDRRPVDDEVWPSRRHTSHRNRSRHHHHHHRSDSSSRKHRHRHRSRSDERRSRYRSSRHRDRKSPRASSAASSSFSSSTASSPTSSPRSQVARSPPRSPLKGEAVLPLVPDNSAAPTTSCGVGAVELEYVAPPAVSMEVSATGCAAAAVAEKPASNGEEQREAAEVGILSGLPDDLHQRVPLLITTYHALQTALELVQGEASALPPLEHVRVALLANLERVLMPPLKESFVHSWWLSLVNALDVECQFVVTADRMGNEVRGFLSSTILPDAGERLVHFGQHDGSIWAIMNVQVCAVPVEAPVAASPPESGSGGRPRLSGSDIDAAKVAHLFSIISKHILSTGCRANYSGRSAAFAANGGAPAARVVIVCSARREQSLVVTQLQRLLSEQEHDAHAAMTRVTERAEVFRESGAEVLVVTDAQLADPRVLRDVHQCTDVDLIFHFSLPRPVMMRLEKEEIIDVLAQRGRAILGSSKRFCARRWWQVEAAASAAGDDTAFGVPNNAADFVLGKVECLLLLTEHNMSGRAGLCVTEALREVSSG
ncbi:hypothetical protein LSCM1_05686 [Leishmania martiniquensis]|uniref:Uncharacterized protein n=1 Tax=Leishmania martiniquensis TaxID=1580590 RepID=A0A836GZG2_9TRYP|nr:hypothetical protein LSCM1_05686 [Leishmania martiniquensis]